MDAATRNFVRQRAENRCEYCGLHEDLSPLAALHVEHIRPKKHGGSNAEDNLALACIDCNLHKGTNIAGYDPETQVLQMNAEERLQLRMAGMAAKRAGHPEV
jgi:5-methylcytosine-specific restriction endonuclease McrA